MKTNTTRAKYNNGKETNRFNNTNLQESNIKTSNNIVKKSFADKTMNFFRGTIDKNRKKMSRKSNDIYKKNFDENKLESNIQKQFTTFIIFNRYKKVIKNLEQMGQKF